MRKPLVWLLYFAFVFAQLAHAQVGVGNGPQPSHVDPTWQMPPAKIPINQASFAAKRFGLASDRVMIVCHDTQPNCAVPFGLAPTDTHTSDGAFRILCPYSHIAYDDPIVWPGQPGKTHPHDFFGNDTTSSSSDLLNQSHVGTSTCQGGTINLTGYWIPPWVYLCTHPDIVPCDPSRNGNVFTPKDTAIFYYKTGNASVGSGGNLGLSAAIAWPPDGLRMIAGNASSAVTQGTSIVRYDCLDSGNNNDDFFDHTPTTAEAAALSATNNCLDLEIIVLFPQCWNNVDLFLPGTAHMAYGTPGLSCSAATAGAFPVMFPKISFNVHIALSTINDLDYLVLSSDLPEVVGVTQTSADASHIKLAASEPATVGHYTNGMLWVGGVGRRITAWDQVNKIATLATALPSTPALGTRYAARNARGASGHGDWANGWRQSAPLLNGKTVTQIILEQCVRPQWDCNSGLLGNPFGTQGDTTTVYDWYYLF